MTTNPLQTKLGRLLKRHGDKIDKGVTSVERFAARRAKGREQQVGRTAKKVRDALARQRAG